MEIPTLPTDLAAEMAVIGSCLLDRDAIILAATLLSSDDLEAFYMPQHRAIYSALLKLYAERVPCDLVTLASELSRTGDIDGIGGIPGLERFMSATPTAQHVEYYVREVLKTWSRRLAIEAGSQITAIGFGGGDDETMYAKAQAIYDRAFNRKQTARLVSMDQASTGFLETLGKGGAVGHPTGLETLDNLLGGGLHRGDLIMVAALTSGGKTAFACQVALNLAKREAHVLYGSLEMKSEALMARFVAIQSGVASEKIRQPDRLLQADDFQKVVDAAGEMTQLPISIDDDFGATISDIRSRALALQAETGSLALVIVDYIQLISAPGVSEENRAREVAKFSRGLKTLAGELNCPVMALSQFSRAAANRGGVPKLSDLKESSALEQDADVVLILHRPDLYSESAPKGMCEVHIAKQRQGPLGKAVLNYAPDTGRWRDFGGFRTPTGY